MTSRQWPEQQETASGGQAGGDVNGGVSGGGGGGMPDFVTTGGGAGGAGPKNGGSGGDEPGSGGGSGPTLAACVRLPASGGQSYAFCYEQPLSFWDAEADCQRRGGHLVSIHTQDQQMLITDGAFAGSGGQRLQWWIGLTDSDVEGSFLWTDGSPVDYIDWSPGEPNDAGGVEDCAHLYDTPEAFWNDLTCDFVKPYICLLPS